MGSWPRRRPRRIPDFADRLHRPGPQSLDAAALEPWPFPLPATPPPIPPSTPWAACCRHNLEGQGVGQLRLLMGLARDKQQAVDLIVPTPRDRRRRGCHCWLAQQCEKHGRTSQPSPLECSAAKTFHAIRHGEIPPGTPQPYWSFLDAGRTLLVHTPFTPRPYDHTMSNSAWDTSWS